jgi:hypothetical protein
VRDRVQRLERLLEGEFISIPQKDGSIKRFPPCAFEEAFLCAMARIGAGEDAPPRHPLLEAARNSSEPRWRESYFSDIDYEGATEPVEDLSE